MRHRNVAITLTVAIVILSCWIMAVGAPTFVVAVLGLALFGAPGYVWTDVLLGSCVIGMERIVVATGVTLAVPVLGGVALYASGVQLHRFAWVGLLAGVTLAGDGVLLIRGGFGVAEQKRSTWRVWPSVRHAATLGVAVVIAVAALGLARAGATMQHYQGFTELWLSPSAPNATTADLGVSNHQGIATRYRLVLLSGSQVRATWSLTLSDGQTWQRTVPVSDGHEIHADLYRLPDLTDPYRHVTIARGS